MGYFAVLSPKTVGTTRSYPQAPHPLFRMGSRRLCIYRLSKPGENLDQKTIEWIQWAKAKADWYDPTIARKDEFFGKREHQKNADQKKLEHASYFWWRMDR